MSERTFAGSIIRGRLQELDYIDTEFLRIGAGLFESEELVDAVYRIYLALLAERGWMGEGPGDSRQDLGWAYQGGFYLPCTERVALAGQIDLLNDSCPSTAGLVTMSAGGRSPSFISVRAQTPPPRGIVAPPGTRSYAVTIMGESDASAHRLGRPAGERPSLSFMTSYVALTPKGVFVPCILKHYFQDSRGATSAGLSCQMAAVTINASEDARFLWGVDTSENVLAAIPTPLRLGVSEEHVKSLFYARQAPVTETGRRRPIMHWVQAHQRRLRQGIEIDITKHLRGINEFDMDGFHFKIVNPIKQAPAASNRP